MVELEVAKFAAWLAKAPTRRWSVDGNDLLAELLAFPCTGAELGAALARAKRKLRIFQQGNADAADDIEKFATRDADGGLSFEVAWEDAPDERWFVNQDVESERLFEDVGVPRSA